MILCRLLRQLGLPWALITNNNDRQTGLCQSERLVDECTIFQAEVLAILRACQPIKEYFMLNPDKKKQVHCIPDLA